MAVVRLCLAHAVGSLSRGVCLGAWPTEFYASITFFASDRWRCAMPFRCPDLLP